MSKLSMGDLSYAKEMPAHSSAKVDGTGRPQEVAMDSIVGGMPPIGVGTNRHGGSDCPILNLGDQPDFAYPGYPHLTN